MVCVAGPQLKVITPPPLLAAVRAVSKAASVQLAGEPVPTTASAARAVWRGMIKNMAAIRKSANKFFIVFSKNSIFLLL
jgi:hypothetical protein